MSSPLHSHWRSFSLTLLAGSLLAIPVIGAVGSHLSKRPVDTSLSIPRSGMVLFHTGDSSMEREFLGTLPLDQVRVVPVARLDSGLAQRFGVRSTPTLLRIAGGKETGRYETAKAISAALQPPAHQPRICRLRPVARLR